MNAINKDFQHINQQRVATRDEGFARLARLLNFDVRHFPTDPACDRHVAITVGKDEGQIAFRVKLRDDEKTPTSTAIVFEAVSGAMMKRHQSLVLMPQPQGWMVKSTDDKHRETFSVCPIAITDAQVQEAVLQWAGKNLPRAIQPDFIEQVKKSQSRMTTRRMFLRALQA